MSAAPKGADVPGEKLPPGTPAHVRRLHSEYAITIGIIAFCAIVYAVTLTFPDLPPALSSGMGPAVFPRLLLGVIAALALLLAFLARGKTDEAREPIPAMVYWTALAMVAFMGVLWLIGMAAAMFLGFVGLGLLWGERRWSILVIAGLALSALIYALFVKGFAIPLPRGVVGDWFF
jgi:Tripartite tricarboxylate transporter TctB family